MKDQLSGALTGIAVAAAAHWARYDDDSQRRLRNVRLDAEEALDQIRQMQSHAELLRSRLPVVMDAQVGIALASPQPTAPSVVPSTVPLTRPDLATQMEAAVTELSWPPEPGQYDERGLIKQTGELTSLFLALTYEEVRAFLQALPQSRAPSADGKVQIFSAANSLIAQLGTQKLTWQQYKDAWARVFGSTASATATATTVPVPAAPEPHTDASRPPVVSALGGGVASAVPLTSVAGCVPGYPYANKNTDKAMRFRMTTSNTVVAGTPLVTVTFGSEFREDGGPIQPVVLVSGDPQFYTTNVTAQSFVLKSTQHLAGNQSYDFSAATFRPSGG